MMHKIIYLSLAGLILVGCNTKPIDQMSYADKKKLTQTLLDKCKSLGINPNSEEYKQCFYAEVKAEQYKRLKNKDSLQRSQAYFAGMSTGATASESLANANLAANGMPIQNRQRTVVNCTSSTFMGTVRTQCQ